jgi:hypothetical protein
MWSRIKYYLASHKGRMQIFHLVDRENSVLFVEALGWPRNHSRSENQNQENQCWVRGGYRSHHVLPQSNLPISSIKWLCTMHQITDRQTLMRRIASSCAKMPGRGHDDACVVKVSKKPACEAFRDPVWRSRIPGNGAHKSLNRSVKGDSFTRSSKERFWSAFSLIVRRNGSPVPAPCD